MTGDIANGAQRDAGGFHVDQQETDAFLFFLRLFVGTRQHVDVRRVVRHRGPDLAAVDDVIIAIRHGFGAQTGQIRTGIRFGIALAPGRIAGDDLRQILLALRVVAETDQRRADHGQSLVGHAADTGAFSLLKINQQLRRRQPHAAVFTRPVRRNPAFF